MHHIYLNKYCSAICDLATYYLKCQKNMENICHPHSQSPRVRRFRRFRLLGQPDTHCNM